MLNTRLSEQEKQLGLELIETNNATFLETMRSKARMICRKQGTITADDVREYYEQHKHELQIEPTSPNTWGAIFTTKEWEWVGYQKSKRVSNHSRPIGVWRLK